MRTRTISGTYGSQGTETQIFVADLYNGGSWYVCEGGTGVNFTYDEIREGCNVEELQDVDFFTWSAPITSEEEMETAIND